LAKFANGQTYRPGNDNLNEQQFSAHSFGSTRKMFTGPTSPVTETRTTTRQGKGEKGGKWKKKGRRRIV
jgi:hypothetical protein